MIATAAANGRVVLYDINRAGVELARLHEHNRQVHKLAFNPHQGALLLSGSQDATIRMWDLRILGDKRDVMAIRSVNTYTGNNEGIRDVRWSPADGMEFAACTDNGVIQRWDFRNDRVPLLKINGHEKTCHTIDWHPDGKYLASGGADKNVKIWDFVSTDRRMKPFWQLKAPQAVLKVQWRPSFRPLEFSKTGSMLQTQLATSYDQHDPRIHVWDLRRPHMPFQEMDRYDTAPTDMLWHSENLLWTVGIAGMFTQTDMNFVSKTTDHRSGNSVTTAPDGGMCAFSEARTRRRISLPDASSDMLQRTNTNGSSGERLSGSHSATDGSCEEHSMLTSSLKKRRQKMSNTRSNGHTSPSVTSTVPTVIFEEAMKKGFIPSQIVAYGHVLGVFDADAFKFLASRYSSPALKSTKTENTNLHLSLQESFERNGALTEQTGHYRLAQTWRIIGLSVRKDLGERATLAMQERLAESGNDSIRKQSRVSVVLSEPTSEIIQDGHRNKESSLRIATASESTSNLATPLVRPVQGLPGLPDNGEVVLSPKRSLLQFPADAAKVPLPPSSHEELELANRSATYDHSRSISELVLDAAKDELQLAKKPTSPDQASQQASQNFENFSNIDQQMYERRVAMNNYRAKARPLLTLDEPIAIPANQTKTPRFDRHDSNESFQMFSASVDSSHKARSMGGSFSNSQESGGSASDFRRWTSTNRKDSFEGHSLPEEDEFEDTFMEEQTVDIDLLGDKESASNFIPDDLKENISLSPLKRPTNPHPPIVHLSSEKPAAGRIESSIVFQNPEGQQGKPTPTPAFLPSDFSPPDPKTSDPASNETLPWSPQTLIPPLLHYHLNTLSDTQFPALLTLYLASLYPSIFPVPYATMILHAYHSQLLSLQLFTEAALLRNQCHPVYPEISTLSNSTETTSRGFWCTECCKPVKGDRFGWCERCKTAWGPCSICERYCEPSTNEQGISDETLVEEYAGRIAYPGPASSGGALWLWCQRCGHGGHAGCLEGWFALPLPPRTIEKVDGRVDADADLDVDSEPSEDPSGGECPMPTCGCDCLPGPHRDSVLATIEEEELTKRRKGGIARRDDWVVNESKAVGEVRTRGMGMGMLSSRSDLGAGAGSGGGLSGISGGLRSQSGALSAGLGPGPGPGGGLGSAKKSVRIAAPNEAGGTGTGMGIGVGIGIGIGMGPNAFTGEAADDVAKGQIIPKARERSPRKGDGGSETGEDGTGTTSRSVP